MTTEATLLIIAGSVRPNRVSPCLAQWLAGIAAEVHPGKIAQADLRDYPLPMDAEPALPQTGHYDSPLTRAWSATVAAADAVLFVTPQYNWGYPAPLKNAIDHLYREWRGKPALILAYGGHGGGKCAAQLAQVLEGLKMRLEPAIDGLSLPRAMIEDNRGAFDPAALFAAELPRLREALAGLSASARQPRI